MSNQIRISAKNLGELALPNFCPRCFWLKLRLSNRLPFQIFPGIFSSIDAYTKNIIHSWFDVYKSSPTWLSGLGVVTRYKEPPHFSKFNILDRETNVLFTGSPDGVFVRPDNSHIIVDYKTAKYTGTQDGLFPMYEVQLNGYALIGEQRGLKPVSDLALIYMEPVTNCSSEANCSNHRDNGFIMGFSAYVHKVGLNVGMLQPLLVNKRDL